MFPSIGNGPISESAKKPIQTHRYQKYKRFTRIKFTICTSSGIFILHDPHNQIMNFGSEFSYPNILP